MAIPITKPFNASDQMMHDRLATLGLGTKQYVLTTDTGDVVIRWPEKMSQEDYFTVATWLDRIKNKMKRSVTDDAQT